METRHYILSLTIIILITMLLLVTIALFGPPNDAAENAAVPNKPTTPMLNDVPERTAKGTTIPLKSITIERASSIASNLVKPFDVSDVDFANGLFSTAYAAEDPVKPDLLLLDDWSGYGTVVVMYHGHSNNGYYASRGNIIGNTHTSSGHIGENVDMVGLNTGLNEPHVTFDSPNTYDNASEQYSTPNGPLNRGVDPLKEEKRKTIKDDLIEEKRKTIKDDLIEGTPENIDDRDIPVCCYPCKNEKENNERPKFNTPEGSTFWFLPIGMCSLIYMKRRFTCLC